MYGSLREELEGTQMDEEAAHRLVERSNRNGDEVPATFRFEDPFDTDFWEAVSIQVSRTKKSGLSEPLEPTACHVTCYGLCRT